MNDPAPPSTPEARRLIAFVKTTLSKSPSYIPPKLPSLATELKTAARDPNVDLAAARHILEGDVLASARALRRAQNTLLLGRRTISSLSEACARLGLYDLVALCEETPAIEGVLDNSSYELVLRLLGRHSRATALLSRFFAARYGIDEDLAYLAGLLHDIGIAVGFVATAERAIKLHEAPPHPMEAWPAVRETAAQAAQTLARAWSLAPEVIKPAVHHHDVAPPSDRLTSIVAISNWAASVSGFGFADEDDMPSPAMLMSLSLGAEDLKGIAEEAAGLLAHAAIT